MFIVHYRTGLGSICIHASHVKDALVPIVTFAGLQAARACIFRRSFAAGCRRHNASTATVHRTKVRLFLALLTAKRREENQSAQVPPDRVGPLQSAGRGQLDGTPR